MAYNRSREQEVLKLPSVRRARLASPRTERDAFWTLLRSGRHPEAEAAARDLVARFPDHHFGWMALGDVLGQTNRSGEALPIFEKAASLSPRDPEICRRLGTTLMALGRPDQALESFTKAVKLQPDSSDFHNDVGNALALLSRPAEACASYARAVKIKPDLAEAHNNMGSALNALGRSGEALASCTKALKIRADYPEANLNLGNALRNLDRLEEALGAFVKAAAIRPNFASAYSNMGFVLQELGRLDEAAAAFAKVLEITPKDLGARSSYLFVSHYLDRHSPEVLRNIAEQFGRLSSGRVDRAFTTWRPGASGGALRVGLVSGDLGNHPVGLFLEGLLRAIDPNRVEFLAFPCKPAEDDLTIRLKSCVSVWEPIHHLNDEAAARIIHTSGVDVLLDLSGHTKANRLPLFAWKPAPVQASWLGYFATTGVAEMDYILGDRYVTPAGEANHFTETVWSLPDAYLCFTPPAMAVAVSPLPMLSRGFLTFGSFNNLAKVTDAVVAVWARVLQAVPGSRLMLKTSALGNPAMQDSVRSRFARHGVVADRLLLEPASPRVELLQTYRDIDICLDPFPYPGATTSLEALWMGVPVLSKRGDRFLSHIGETIAHNAGLPEWIADDDDDYVARAVRFASDPSGLARLRSTLRENVLASPLFDSARFARNFEDAIGGMWDHHLKKQLS